MSHLCIMLDDGGRASGAAASAGRLDMAVEATASARAAPKLTFSFMILSCDSGGAVRNLAICVIAIKTNWCQILWFGMILREEIICSGIGDGMDLLEKAADAGQKTGRLISVELPRSSMHRHFKHFIHRHEPKGHWHGHLKSGAGAVTGMVAVGALTIVTGIPLLRSHPSARRLC